MKITVQVLGLDIGGANIKAASSDGNSEQLPFAIWKSPEQLADRLRSLQLLSSLQPGLVGDCGNTEWATRTVSHGNVWILAAS